MTAPPAPTTMVTTSNPRSDPVKRSGSEGIANDPTPIVAVTELPTHICIEGIHSSCDTHQSSDSAAVSNEGSKVSAIGLASAMLLISLYAGMML